MQTPYAKVAMQLAGFLRLTALPYTIAAFLTLLVLAPMTWCAASPLSQDASAEEFTTDGYDTSAADAADRAADRAAAASAAEHSLQTSKIRLPGPAAGVAVATPLPTAAASFYRAGILKLLNSITSLSDTNTPSVEAVLGTPIGRPEGTDQFFGFYGPLEEGGYLSATLWPSKSRDRSSIRIRIDRPQGVKRDAEACAIPADSFISQMRRDGFDVDSRAYVQRNGERSYGYIKDLAAHGVRVAGTITLHVPIDRAEPLRCLSNFEINAAPVRGHR